MATAMMLPLRSRSGFELLIFLLPVLCHLQMIYREEGLLPH
jgi:hypothetical protein